VTTAPVERSRQPWAGTMHARTERPRPPRGVAIAAGILYVYAAINLVVALAMLAISVMAVVDGDDSPSWMVLVLGLVAVHGFFVMLAAKTRQGRRWAWITTLILLSLFALLGLGVVAIGLTDGGLTDGGLTDGGAPPLAGLLLLVPTSLFILLLAGPRSSRKYFRRR
jgi:hypothetical protein